MVFGLCPLNFPLPRHFDDHHLYFAVILIKAMDAKESPSQEVPPPHDQHAQPVPEVPPAGPSSSTPTPIAETLTAEEAALLRRFRSSSTRSSLPPKKSKIDPKPAWQEFLQALSVKKIELSDLDYNLQQELQTSEQARADFLASTSPLLMLSLLIQNKANIKTLSSPRRGHLLISNKLHQLLKYHEIYMKETMMQHHQDTVMPNHTVLLEACKEFYTQTALEHYYKYNNILLDTMDTRQDP